MVTIEDQGLSYVQYHCDGAAVNFMLTFPYLREEDISVFLDGVLVPTDEWSWLNSSEIQMDVAPDLDALLTIKRTTEQNERLVDFQDGGQLSEETLDLDSNQMFYLAQEAIDTTNFNLAINSTDSTIDAQNNKIINLAEGTDPTDAVNKSQLDAVQIIAESAASDAATALSTANAIAATANTALSTANTALATANTALVNADAAATTADNALDVAEGIEDVANEALIAAEDALDTVAIVQSDVNDLITLSGRPFASTTMGTFTGVTIPDNSNTKQALQALETAVESAAPAVPHTATYVPYGDGDATFAESNEFTFEPITHKLSIGKGATGSDGTLELGGNTGLGTILGGGDGLNIDTVDGTLALKTFGITGLSIDGIQDTTILKSIVAERSQENVSTDSSTTGANATLADPTTPIVRVTNGALTSLDMIANPFTGRIVTLINATGSDLVVNNNTGGTAANRILTGTKAAITLADEASLILKYDNVEQKWMVIGGTGSGSTSSSTPQSIFTLNGSDVSQWSTGDNSTFLGGGTLAGSFVSDTSTPLHGAVSYQYTQAAGSLDDYLASPAQTVDLRFRGIPVTLLFPYTYNGSNNDIEVILYDVTNAAIIPNSAYIQATSGNTVFKTNVTIPLTCTSIRVGFHVKVLNNAKVLNFDDVQLTSDTTVMADIQNQIQSLNASSVSGATIDLTTGTSSGRGLFTVSGAILTAVRNINLVVSVGVQATSIAAGNGASVLVSGAFTIGDGGRATTTGQVTQASTSVSERLLAGQSITLAAGATGGMTSISHSYSVLATASSTNILTAPDTFSTDTTTLTYANAATYTLATLPNSPIGTYITGTYTINTNTRTQTTSTNRPTQTDADMNANGILLYPRAYNAASLSTQPAFIAINIGKGMKGLMLNLYGSSGKVNAGSTDYLQVGTTEHYGFRSKDYNEATGILILDVGTAATTVTLARFILSDQTVVSSGYLTISASKNPALTGLNISAITARGVNTAGTSVANTGTTALVLDTTKSYDTHGALVAATGIFTAPESGYYRVTAKVQFVSNVYAINNRVLLQLFKNGSSYSSIAFATVHTTTSVQMSLTGEDTIYLNKGETCAIEVANNRTAGATALDTAAMSNYVVFEKVSVG